MTHKGIKRKTALLATALIAALLAITATAAVLGHSNFKQEIREAGAPEVAELVQEVHRAAESADPEGFDFSIDEIIWEAGDLYVSYSLSVPEGGRFLVAMSNPTLNGEKLTYDARGWTEPKFIDPAEDGAPALLLLGGERETRCNELWTFAVDPRLREKADNHLAFRAVLLSTDLDLTGSTDWTDLLNPPEVLSLDFTEDVSPEQQAFMDALRSSQKDGLSLDALTATGHAEYVAEREISMSLNAAALPEVAYNDVAERDFDLEGFHIHVDAFRMTHLGVSLEYTFSINGAAGFEDILDESWRFGTPDGKALGYDMGSSGSASRDALDDGTAVYHCAWRENLILPLEGLDRIIFAPVTYMDDAGGNPLPPVYDMSRAITLTPTLHPEITPTPTVSPIEPGEDISR